MADVNNNYLRENWITMKVMQPFLEKAISWKDGPCLIWPYRTLGGYAVSQALVHRGKSRYICPYILEQIKGPPPTPLHEARHICGNGAYGCVAGNHLEWGTHLENMGDYIGEDHGSSKLTREEVLKLLSMRGQYPQRQLAEIFGISQSHVCAIMNKKYWSWLTSTEFKYEGPDLFH
jgi:hypothetical protein